MSQLGPPNDDVSRYLGGTSGEPLYSNQVVRSPRPSSIGEISFWGRQHHDLAMAALKGQQALAIM
jgi:hypothetical protein